MPRFRVEPLPTVTKKRRIMYTLAILLCTLFALAAPFYYSGVDFTSLLSTYVSKWISNPRWASFSLSEVMRYAIAMMFTGLAGVLAFRSRVWNIGLEGYMILGSVATAALAYAGLHWLEPMAAFAIGAAWGAIVAALMLLGVNEIVSSMMLYYVAVHILLYAVYRVWPGAYGFPSTPRWGTSQPMIYGIPAMLFVSILACIAAHVLYYRSTWGLIARLVGVNERAARTAGYNVTLVKVLVLVVSSGVAALAGYHIASLKGYLDANYAKLGYGFAGITIAFLAGLEPLYVPLAAFFMAFVYHLGTYASSVGVAGSFGVFFYYVQGVLLLAVLAARTLPRYRIVVVR